MKQHQRNRSRANRLANGLKTVGAYEGALDWKATIVDTLSDLRHLCDKLDRCDRARTRQTRRICRYSSRPTNRSSYDVRRDASQSQPARPIGTTDQRATRHENTAAPAIISPVSTRSASITLRSLSSIGAGL